MILDNTAAEKTEQVIKVLYDHQMFSLQRYGGISRYFANLYHSFIKGNDIAAAVPLLYSNNQYLKNETSLLPAFAGKIIASKKSRLYKWNKICSQMVLRKNSFDLFHPTYYDAYFLKDLKKPYVITVHDLIYEIYPQYFDAADKFIINKEQVIRKADHIIAISESTRKDLQRFYNIADEKITVIHHGFYPETTAQPPQDFNSSNYLLFVGDRANYKNFQLFAEAIAPLLITDKSLQLICTGGGLFEPDEKSYLQALGIAAQVQQINASNEELNFLYQHAKLFVFPSLYEGFGFPLLEAFSNNCAVAASNTSSFAEVGGNAVAYFDPQSKSEMHGVILQLLNNSAAREQLIEQGKKQVQQFTIDSCVQKTAAVYRAVLNR